MIIHVPVSRKMQKILQRVVTCFDAVSLCLHTSVFFEHYNRILLCE